VKAIAEALIAAGALGGVQRGCRVARRRL